MAIFFAVLMENKITTLTVDLMKDISVGIDTSLILHNNCKSEQIKITSHLHLLPSTMNDQFWFNSRYYLRGSFIMYLVQAPIFIAKDNAVTLCHLYPPHISKVQGVVEKKYNAEKAGKDNANAENFTFAPGKKLLGAKLKKAMTSCESDKEFQESCDSQRLIDICQHSMKNIHLHIAGVPNLSNTSFDTLTKCPFGLKGNLTKSPDGHTSLRDSLTQAYQDLYIDFGLFGCIVKDKDEDVIESTCTDIEGLNGEQAWILICEGNKMFIDVKYKGPVIRSVSTKKLWSYSL